MSFAVIEESNWDAETRSDIASLLDSEFTSLDLTHRLRALTGLVSGAVSWSDFCDYTAKHWGYFTDEERSGLLVMTVVLQLQGRVDITEPSPRVVAERLTSLSKSWQRVTAIKILCIESAGGAPICLQSPAPGFPPEIYAAIHSCYSEHKRDQTFALALISHATTQEGQTNWTSPPYRSLLRDQTIQSILSVGDLTASQYFSLPTIQSVFLCASQARNRPFRVALISKLKQTTHPTLAILPLLGWEAHNSQEIHAASKIVDEFNINAKYTFARCRPKFWQPTSKFEWSDILVLQNRLDNRLHGINEVSRTFAATKVPREFAATQIQPQWQKAAALGEWIAPAPPEVHSGEYVSNMYLAMGAPTPEDFESTEFLLSMFEDAISSGHWSGFAAATTFAANQPEYRSQIMNLMKEHVQLEDRTAFMFGTQCLERLKSVR
jgi:hypothetical protein